MKKCVQWSSVSFIYKICPAPECLTHSCFLKKQGWTTLCSVPERSLASDGQKQTLCCVTLCKTWAQRQTMHPFTTRRKQQEEKHLLQLPSWDVQRNIRWDVWLASVTSQSQKCLFKHWFLIDMLFLLAVYLFTWHLATSLSFFAAHKNLTILF